MRIFLALAFLLVGATTIRADVDLFFDPPSQCAQPGEVITVNLVAATDGGVSQEAAAFDIILIWDAANLELLGNDDGGAGHPWLASGFPNNQDGLNAGIVVPFVDVPSNDGDAFYVALAGPTDPADVPPPGGLVITTFQFEVLNYVPAAEVSLLDAFGTFSETRVLSSGLPSVDLTGDTSAVGNIGVPNEDCPGDLSGNRNVDLEDLAIILVNFGMTNASFMDGDLDCDGDVDLQDLATLLSVFGVVCP